MASALLKYVGVNCFTYSASFELCVSSFICFSTTFLPYWDFIFCGFGPSGDSEEFELSAPPTWFATASVVCLWSRELESWDGSALALGMTPWGTPDIADWLLFLSMDCFRYVLLTSPLTAAAPLRLMTSFKTLTYVLGYCICSRLLEPLLLAAYPAWPN